MPNTNTWTRPLETPATRSVQGKSEADPDRLESDDEIPQDRDEQREELAELSEHGMAAESVAIASKGKAISATTDQVEMEGFADAHSDAAFGPHGISPVNERAAEDNSPEVERLCRQRDEQMSKIHKNNSPLSKNWTKAQVSAAILGVLGTLSSASVAIAMAVRAVRKQPYDDIPMDDKTIALLFELAQELNDLPDTAYWLRFADIVDRYELTVASQVVFLNFTQLLSNVTLPWIWRSTSEQEQAIKALERAYITNSRYSDLYRGVTVQTFWNDAEGREMPMYRNVAANNLTLALIDLVQGQAA